MNGETIARFNYGGLRFLLFLLVLLALLPAFGLTLHLGAEHLVGLGVVMALASFGVKLSHMSVWRDMQEQAKRIEQQRRWRPVRVLVTVWHVLTERVADRNAQAEMVVFKLMMWSWRLTK